MTKDDVMESVGNAYSSLGTLNTGKNRVRGAELSLAGNIPRSRCHFGVAVMESEILEAFNPAQVGLALSNFADDSAYVQLRYQVTPKFSFGGSITYKGEMFGGQPDTAAGSTRRSTTIQSSCRTTACSICSRTTGIPIASTAPERRQRDGRDLWTAAYRSGTFMYLGDARSAQATVSWGF